MFLKISLWNYSLQVDFVGISESADTVRHLYTVGSEVGQWKEYWLLLHLVTSTHMVPK